METGKKKKKKKNENEKVRKRAPKQFGDYGVEESKVLRGEEIILSAS